MQVHATFILKCSKCKLCMQQCNANGKLYNAHDILSYFWDFDFDFDFDFDLILFVENTN